MKKGDRIPVYSPKMLQSLFATQEAQAYAMAFLSFFALAFFTIFAIRPTLTSFFNLRKQISDAHEMNKQLDSKINMLLAAQQTYQDYQTEIELLEHALPKDPQFAQLIQKLESIINEKESTATAFSTSEEIPLLSSQPRLRTLAVNPPPSGDESSDTTLAPSAPIVKEMPVESVKFSLTILSDYTKNEAVIAQMLNLKRLIALTLLEFTADDEESSDQKAGIETVIDAEAYYLPEDTK